jgi:hypothetical protein
MSCPRSSRGFSRVGSTDFNDDVLAIKLFCLNTDVQIQLFKYLVLELRQVHDQAIEFIGDRDLARQA